MRKLIYAINLTVDGCCDHTKMTPEEEMFEYHTQLVRDADVFAYGRKTYQLMVPYWPDILKWIHRGNPAISTAPSAKSSAANPASGVNKF
jgi:hypothetical protein